VKTLKLWGIVQIGLSVYIIGRSTKKTLLGITKTLNGEYFYATTARQLADSEISIAVAEVKEYQFIRGIVLEI
jgi:hypothetical protein